MVLPMKHEPFSSSKYRSIYIVGLWIAAVVILVGSIWAYASQSPDNAITRPFTNILSALTRSNLIVKTDHTRLPANGSAQTTITASYPKTAGTMTAKIISGTGTIARTGDGVNPATFTYTAGISIGNVVIEVSLDSISETVELELVEPITPGTPQITDPPTGTKTNQVRPDIIGSAPANSKVVISANGQINTTTKADSNGVFRARLDKALTNGQQNITAIAVNDLEIASPPSEQIVIEVISDPLKYDSESVRFSPRPVVAGNSFGLFIPASLNTEKVLVEFEGTTYELKDTNGSSIFSRSLPAPANPGTYPASIILVDAANNSTRFDNALYIAVVAP